MPVHWQCANTGTDLVTLFRKHMMTRAILKSPRILRSGQPLTLAGINQVCPAVFAPAAAPSRGPRYRYVPTIEPVQLLLNNGWGIYEASQQRSRAADKDPYTKHMLRLRLLKDFDAGNYLKGDGVPEVILINAHDGTAAYHLKAGFFRFVCSNGLMVGKQVTGITVRHTVGPQTSAEVIDAATRIVTESFPHMLENIDLFKGIVLQPGQAYRLAQTALDLRFANTLAPITAQQLLTVRRVEDEAPTLWNVLNVVQENAVYGGLESTSAGFGRRQTMRPVERVSAVSRINAGIWDAASALAVECA